MDESFRASDEGELAVRSEEAELLLRAAAFARGAQLLDEASGSIVSWM